MAILCVRRALGDWFKIVTGWLPRNACQTRDRVARNARNFAQCKKMTQVVVEQAFMQKMVVSRKNKSCAQARGRASGKGVPQAEPGNELGYGGGAWIVERGGGTFGGKCGVNQLEQQD